MQIHPFYWIRALRCVFPSESLGLWQWWRMWGTTKIYLSKVSRMVLIKHDSVVMLSSSISPTSWMLPVLSNSTMSGWDMPPLLPVLAQPYTAWAHQQRNSHTQEFSDYHPASSWPHKMMANFLPTLNSCPIEMVNDFLCSQVLWLLWWKLWILKGFQRPPNLSLPVVSKDLGTWRVWDFISMWKSTDIADHSHEADT